MGMIAGGVCGKVGRCAPAKVDKAQARSLGFDSQLLLRFASFYGNSNKGSIAIRLKPTRAGLAAKANEILV
jgi:hypothetical protein